MSAIETRELCKRFGDFVAVDAVSFSVEPGEIFGMVGPNGAGKSTLIRMLTTLLVPSSGWAAVNGFDVSAEPDRVRRSIGVIPQAATSDLELSVDENLTIFARLYGVEAAARRRAIDEVLEAVQLERWRHAPVRNLSGGMRRRAEIARGLVHEPRTLFLDEPTTGLDPVSRTAVWDLLLAIRARRGTTLFLTTHYMDEADALCDRVAIVDRGTVVALDTPAGLKGSVPGSSVLEVSLGPAPPGWAERLQELPHVERLSTHDSALRIWTRNGPGTALALMQAAAASRVEVRSLAVQGTSLDDVFVHYTGRALRDGLGEPSVRDRLVPRRE